MYQNLKNCDKGITTLTCFARFRLEIYYQGACGCSHVDALICVCLSRFRMIVCDCLCLSGIFVMAFLRNYAIVCLHAYFFVNLCCCVFAYVRFVLPLCDYVYSCPFLDFCIFRGFCA